MCLGGGGEGESKEAGQGEVLRLTVFCEAFAHLPCKLFLNVLTLRGNFQPARLSSYHLYLLSMEIFGLMGPLKHNKSTPV